MRLCVESSAQMESDQGFPGGKARIIHKESDIITAFAINRVQLLFGAVHLLKALSEGFKLSINSLIVC